MRERDALRRGEDGTVAILLALVMCFVVIPLGGLAVDIGMQRIARTDMQTVADLAAIDMARALGAGTTPTAAMAAASAARDVGTLGSTPTMQVFLGYVDPTSTTTFVSSQSRGCAGSPYDSYFTPASSSKPANAVVVTASNQVNFVIDPGSGGTCRSALARASGNACFALGSYAAAVNSGDSNVLSPLNSIFGLNLSLLSYQNIAGAHLTLGQLAANTRFGTATQLLTGTIKVSDLVLAMIDVLNAQSGTNNSAAVSALNSVLTATATLPTISLANLLHVSPTDTSALTAQFDALNLLAGAVLLADGQHAVSIPNVWANVAGTGETSNVGLYIQQNASTACAPNTATNSQLNGYVDFDKMNSPSINIGVANFKTGVATGQFTLNIAPAQGQVVNPPPMVCGNGTTANPTKFSVQVSSALASAGLAVQMPVTGTVSIAGLGVVSLNLTVDVTASTTQAPGSATANLSIPPNDTTPVTTGSSIRLDPTTTGVAIDPSSTATVLGLPIAIGNSLLASTLSSILTGVQQTFVQKTFNPLIGNLNTMVTGPLSEMLGIEVGGADVYGLPSTCNLPKLAG